MEAKIKLEPNPKNRCFGCGGANEAGMKLAFEQDNQRQRITGRFRLGEKYQGGGEMAHGGIIALLLDEVMGKVLKFREERGVTAQLKIDYLKPVSVTEEIFLEGWQEDSNGRNRFLVGEIRNLEDVVLARAHGRFVVFTEPKAIV